jgi:tetratricopeptide (TPR) repeat protein
MDWNAHRGVYRVAGLAALGLLGAALYSTVRLERADWLFVKGDAASTGEALRLAPGNAEYASALAQAEPDRAVAILRKAAALDPRNAGLRTEWGLAAEQQGDLRGAEASLLAAMRLDTGYAPRWALSDFYFRRGDAEKFWPVTKAALAMSHEDVTGQFRNCWALTSDARTILERAIPERPAVLRQYLDFLLSEGRLDAAEPVAGKLLASADGNAVLPLLHYCGRQLEKGRGEQALTVWNGLARRKLIPHPELAAGGELPLNSDFRAPETGHGFDWQFSSPEGVFADRTSSGLMLGFSGKQPEDVELLSQYVPLLAHRRYVLTVRYRVSGIGAESGLRCTVVLADGHDLLGGRGLLPGGELAGPTPGVRSVPFQTPDGATLGRLVFGYRRMLGTTRIEGSVTLQKFALTLAPGDER